MWDFVKNSVLDNLDGVPEKYKGLYAQNADTKKWELSEAAKGIVGDYTGLQATNTGLQSKLTAANKEAADRRVSTSGLADFLRSQGVENVNAENPLDTLGTYVAGLVEANKKGRDITVNLENIRKESATKLEAVTKAKDEELGKMRKSLETFMIDGEVSRELAAAKGNIAVLTPHIVGRCRVIADGDTYAVRVVNADGSMRSNGTGQPMSISELVGEYKANKDFAGNFESDKKSGNDSKPGGNAQNGPRQPANGDDRRSATSKISAGLAAGQHKQR